MAASMEDSPNVLENSDSEAEKHGGAPYMENNTKNNFEENEQAELEDDNSFIANKSSNSVSETEDVEEEGKPVSNEGENNGSSNNINCENQPTLINDNQEVWIETLSENGKSYYYHAVTRETTWTKPEGPKIKIILQGKVESGDIKSLGSRMIFDNSNPMNIPNRNQGAPGHNHLHHGNNQDLIMNKTGPPPLHQKHPMVSPLFPPQTGFPMGVPGNFNGPPFSVPPPGYSGNHHHHHPAAPWVMPWNLPNKMMHHEHPPKSLIIKPGVIDPNVIARAAEWSEHRAPDGRPYFYHGGRSESVWEKPQAIRDLEAARLAAHSAPPQNSVVVLPKPLLIQNSIPISIVPEQTGFPLSETNINNIYEKPNEPKIKKKESEPEAIKADQNETSKSSQTKKPTAGPADKTRPVSSTPIVGTPWCVVWTGDNRVFFYNPSTRSSVWERPPELIDRADVDKAIANTPQKNPSDSEPETPISTTTVSDPIIEAIKIQTEPDKSAELEVPAKKAKLIEMKVTEKPSTGGEVTKEAAIEAEVRASKERALVPLETRVKSFKEMLREKDVSAFSTWEKELHKIVFDPRYLLLTSRERKQIFEKYVKDRAEEERKEKRNKMRQKRENFRELLESAHLYPKSSYSDFAQKYGKEDKFKAIEKNKERESLFNEYIIEVRKREREEKIHQKEMIKKKFMDMLREKSEVTRHSRWMDIKKKIETDSRYRAVDSSFLREEYFMDYCHLLKEEKRKNKDKGRERDVKKKTKERRKSEENNSERNSTSVHKSETENLSASGTKSDEENEKKQKDRDRQLRAELSIKEREKEVQRSLANHLRDRDKEREHHKRDEAVRHFMALLADLVRNADLTWKEVKKQLKKDHRWELIENLERENRERIFNEHIESLIRKKRDNFREMLDESALELTCSWKDIKKIIKNDPRYLKYNNTDKCEREFRDYIKDKTLIAKTSLRELLQECKLITHKSFESVQENSSHLKEIEEILKNDRRYLMLNHLEHERSQIIVTFLEELHKKGPPPPPTATETSRRK